MSQWGNSPQGSHRDTIEQQAADWLVEEEEGMAPDRRVAFDKWIREDPLHAEALEYLKSAWLRVKGLPDLVASVECDDEADIQEERTAKPIFGKPLLAALAAAAAIAVGFSLSLLWPSVSEIERYASGESEYRYIPLSDGSAIELNEKSQVQIEMTEAARIVRLSAGEAHFVVSKDPSRPFRVFAGGVAVRAVGTAFNVRYGSEQVQVLVTEGRVALESFDRPVREAKPTDLSEIVSEMTSGEFATIAKVGKEIVPTVARIPANEAESLLAWKSSGLIYFNKTPLSAAVERLNARSDGLRIVIEDDELGRQAIGGGLMGANSELFLRLLANDSEIEVVRQGDDVAILRKRK